AELRAAAPGDGVALGPQWPRRCRTHLVPAGQRASERPGARALRHHDPAARTKFVSGPRAVESPMPDLGRPGARADHVQFAGHRAECAGDRSVVSAQSADRGRGNGAGSSRMTDLVRETAKRAFKTQRLGKKNTLRGFALGI